MSVPSPEVENDNADRESLIQARLRMQEPPARAVRIESVSPFADRPGALRGESIMTIKTHLAQQLVFGRPGSEHKCAVIGLIGFAGMLTQISNGAKLDDPYADKWLLEVEAAIDATVLEIAELREGIAQALAQRPDIHHTVAQSVKPLEVPLYFSNQLAFRAAYLVNDFDTLVCMAQTAKYVAVLTTVNSNSVIQAGSKAVRRTFTSAEGYRYTGVSRADIAHGTARAGEALQRWGELPPEILNGTRRAEYGPLLAPDSYAHRIAADLEATERVEEASCGGNAPVP